MRKVLVVILLSLLGLLFAGGVGYGLWRESKAKDKAAQAFIQEARARGHDGALNVTWGTDAESDNMEIVYPIGEGNCLIELEARRDQPRTFWLDEVHTPGRFKNEETDVPALVAMESQPDKQFVKSHVASHTPAYPCAR